MRRPASPAPLRFLWIVGMMAALGFGCADSHSPTAPNVNHPTPVPPGGDISGTWAGTYQTNDSIDCDATKILPAQASFQQNGSAITGTLTANGPCGLGYTFAGTLQGNKLVGDLMSAAAPGFSGSAQGVLSGSTLVISAANGYGFTMGELQLHR